MASVRLGRFEVEEYRLPPTCARCGGKAVVWPDRRFSWSPPWLAALILLNGLGIILYIVLSVSLTKRMTVPLPFCERHRNYWRNRQIFTWGGFAAVVVFGLLAIPLGIILDSKGITDNSLLIASLVTGGLFLTWLLSAAVVHTQTIRASEITDVAITISGLSPDFAEAVREDRRGDDDEDDEDDRPRRRRSRREENDEEEERTRARRREKEDDGGYYDPDENPRRRPRPDAYEEGEDR
jgi:NhaP-type Na+/H+ or K+/H+ antiporter